MGYLSGYLGMGFRGFYAIYGRLPWRLYAVDVVDMQHYPMEHVLYGFNLKR